MSAQPRPRSVRAGADAALRVNDPALAWDAVLCLPFGNLGARCDADAIRQTEYLDAGAPARGAPAALAPLVRELHEQLLAYCRDPRRLPDLPLRPAGSAFQRRVWAALREIPVGRTLRYGELAKQLDSAARAVGQACAANPYAPLVPCHRVVAAHGLGGFAGSTDGAGELLRIKRWLLLHEGALPAPGPELFGDA